MSELGQEYAANHECLRRFGIDADDLQSVRLVQSFADILADLEIGPQLSMDRYRWLLDELEARGIVKPCLAIATKLKDFLEDRTGKPAHALRLREAALLRRLQRINAALEVTAYLMVKPLRRPDSPRLYSALLTTRAAALADIKRY